MIQLYHGSVRILERPFFGGSKDHNDYGNGFYCSENADLAREWSVDDGRDGFLNGTISLRQLEEAMYLGKLGEQIVLKSRESYAHLEFCGYEAVDASLWYPRKAARDRSAREQYFRQDREGWQRGELYMPRILDEEIRPDDTRIQRILY